MQKNKFLLFVVCSFVLNLVSAQTRMVFNNDPFLVFGSNTFLVLENGNNNAITINGSGANIISENETSVIRWEIGNNTGIYTIPFTTKANVNGGTQTKIPLEINITSAGNAAGDLQFATYETSNDLNAPWASDVTHMNNDGGTDNSLFVVDRFWIIDPANYTSKPDVEIDFTYDQAANEVGGTNTITQSNLIAQRFNSTSNFWGDYTGGIANDPADRVEDVMVPAADFFRTWVLVDNSSWLPVELIEFRSECYDGKFELHWSTASETNSDFFIIEYSYDFQNWMNAGTVDAAGNSSSIKNYTFSFLTVNQSTVYFRLKQVDFDGQMNYSNIIISTCNEVIGDIVLYPNPTTSLVKIIGTHLEGKTGKWQLFNSIGQLIHQNNSVQVYDEINLENLPVGIYYLEIEFSGFKKQFKISKV